MLLDILPSNLSLHHWRHRCIQPGSHEYKQIILPIVANTGSFLIHCCLQWRVTHKSHSSEATYSNYASFISFTFLNSFYIVPGIHNIPTNIGTKPWMGLSMQHTASSRVEWHEWLSEWIMNAPFIHSLSKPILA